MLSVDVKTRAELIKESFYTLHREQIYLVFIHLVTRFREISRKFVDWKQ